jgi:hypothetical protein
MFPIFQRCQLYIVFAKINSLYAAIGGEILADNMEYDGETGGNRFMSYKWDYLQTPAAKDFNEDLMIIRRAAEREAGRGEEDEDGLEL